MKTIIIYILVIYMIFSKNFSAFSNFKLFEKEIKISVGYTRFYTKI